MRRDARRIFAVAAAAAIVAAGVAGARAVAGPPAPPGLQTRGGGSSAAHAGSFERFALYWLGDSFEGLPLAAVTRRTDARVDGESVRADFVGFVYGDCVARDESGCAPPLEVQVWPACERTLADYTLTPSADPLPHEPTIVRGVPAAYFEEGLRLELYAGDVTIVVFGLDRTRIQRAAAALRAANALAGHGPMLPRPVPGAIEGELTCSG